MVKYERQRLCCLWHNSSVRLIWQPVQLVEPFKRRIYSGKPALYAGQPRHRGAKQID